MNPVIKFTTLFGLLAVELAVSLSHSQGNGMTNIFALVFFLISMWFVRRSFYGMRIGTIRAAGRAAAGD
jgi:K(+)-stimulated pyrophosphate-energized sodium pump